MTARRHDTTMVITEIRETKRGRFALFDEEGEFLFSVDGETLVKNHVREGAVVDAAALSRLQIQSETRKAKDKALLLLSAREHASGELYEKLRRSFDDHSSAAAVAEMHRLELLDDARYAHRRAAYLAGRHKSSREISCDLAAKGVGKELIADALDALSVGGAGSPDAEACSALVQRHYLRKLAQGQTQSVMAALARRGFSFADARRAIAQALEELEQSKNETE